MSERETILETLATNLSELAFEAWAAGVLDARGRWVILQRRSGFDPRIELRAKSPRGKRDPMLLSMQAEFNGSISMTKSGTVIWQVTGAQRCSVVNDAVLPHLIAKRQKARAHQHLCRRIIEFQRESFDERRIPSEERELRRKLYYVFANIL